MTLLATIFLFVLALVLAELEVQIEGKHGWAEKLPTWRPKPNSKLSRIYAKVMSKRELTGYHIAMFSFVLLILHAPYFMGVKWTFAGELVTLSYNFIFVVVWDFLWFVLNPYYALRKFTGVHIWWHKKWVGFLPVDYYGGFVISFIIYVIGSQYYSLTLMDWVYNVLVWLGLTLAAVVIYLLATGDKVKDL
ncbi:MAG: hypothetical protein ABH884_04200 [Candidatus Komeilibacteria bacterium]